MASAQADFRANDRDGNGKNDFWRGDLAGLYALESGGEPIRLVDLSVAAADAEPVTDIETHSDRSPKAGYWYRALRFAGEKDPDPDRFAAIAYPATPESGKSMYLITHENTIYAKDFQPDAVPDAFPANLKAEGWAKLD